MNKSTAGRGSNGKQTAYGIKKLRELILELAVQGKLVPQEPSDEPASRLLGKITEEKNQLIIDGKIKDQKLLPDISEDESFALPRGWELCRLGTLFNSILSGGTPSKNNPEYWNGNIPWASVKDLGQSKYIEKTQDYITDAGLAAGSKLADIGDILICTRMGLGKIAICKTQIAINQDLKAVKLTSFVNVVYCLIVFSTYNIKGTGTTVAGIKQDELLNFLFQLPPLAEQHRIVAKVDELMALCDQLEQQQTDSNAAHQTLVETLLATLTNTTVRTEPVEARPSTSSGRTEFEEAWQRIDEHFDTLFTTEHSIDQLKQTILQLAVMGKLVPQDPNDEPANILLKRLAVEQNKWLKENEGVNKECAGMRRKLDKLKSPKPPFETPASWSTAHLIQITKFLVDCHNKTAPYVENGIPIIRTSNIRNSEFRMDDMKYVNQDTYEYWSRRCPPEASDIIFTREAPMGEAAIIPDNTKFCLGQRTMLIRVMEKYIYNKYLLLALTEPHLLERASVHAIGSTVKHLRVGDVENLAIPIPPFAEQHRIVAKIDEIMTLCDTLKARINQAQTTQIHLADAIVEQAVA